MKQLLVAACVLLAGFVTPAWADPDLTVEVYGRSHRLGGQIYG